MHIAPNWSLANKCKPPTGPWSNGGPKWPNDGTRSGTYVDMIGEQYKEHLEQEKKGARTGFQRGTNGF